MAGVKLSLNPHATARVVGQHTQAFMNQRLAPYLIKQVQRNITTAGRIDTGKMKNSVHVMLSNTGPDGSTRIEVGSDVPYTSYQEFGTRGHGPVRAKFLRFKPKGAATFVFAKWVRGVTPMRAFQKAVRYLRLGDV